MNFWKSEVRQVQERELLIPCATGTHVIRLESEQVMRSLLIAALIPVLVPNLALAQRVSGVQPTLAAGGSSSARDASDRPGPLWTRRPSAERPVSGIRSKAAAAAPKTEATTAGMAEDEDKLLDRKIRSICRGC